MVLSFIVNRLKALIWSLLNVFRRALCIFQKRRRKPSGDVVMENVIVVSGNESKSGEKLVPWNSWDEDPVAVQNHIDKYRNSLSKLRAASNQDVNNSSLPPSDEPEPEPDYFSDMTPEIKTSSSSLLLSFGSQREQQKNKVTFEVQENFSSTFLATPGLGEMNDEDGEETTAGWETDMDVNQMIKQQKAEERRKKIENAHPKKSKGPYYQ